MDNYSSVNGKNMSTIHYGNHRSVKAEVVAVLEAIFTDRKMKLIESYSRAVKKYDVHELMVTDQNPLPGNELNRMNAIAFIEVINGGLIVSGDKVYHNYMLGCHADYCDSNASAFISIPSNDLLEMVEKIKTKIEEDNKNGI